MFVIICNYCYYFFFPVFLMQKEIPGKKKLVGPYAMQVKSPQMLPLLELMSISFSCQQSSLLFFFFATKRNFTEFTFANRFKSAHVKSVLLILIKYYLINLIVLYLLVCGG